MPKPKPTFPYATALRRAEELRELLRMSCYWVVIAGSLRRMVSQVHDIDLVAWPVETCQTATNLFGEEQALPGAPDALVQGLRAAMIELPALAPDARILRFHYRGIPAEVYLTEPDGLNLGALLQMRTGSAGFNARLAARARDLGLFYKAGYGVFRTNPGSPVLGARVDDGSEAGIFAALGLEFVPPQLRADSTRLTVRKPVAGGAA